MDYTFKVVIIGEGGVGKTTLLHRYIDGRFKERMQMTLGVEFFSKTVECNGKESRLSIWDIGGELQFKNLTELYVRGSSGLVFAFDLTRYTTLERVETWLKFFKEFDIPKIMIGTKRDLFLNGIPSKQIEYYKEMRDYYGFIDYLDTSSKNGLNVDKTFALLTKSMISCLNKERI